MKNKKIILIILLIIFVFLLVFFYFKKDSFIVIGDCVKVKIEDGNIVLEKNNDPILLTKLKVYFNGSFMDGMLKSEKISNDVNHYNIYNSDGNLLMSNNLVLAYQGDYAVNMANPTIEEFSKDSSSDRIYKFLEENEVLGEIEYYRKYNLDINNDQNEECIYSIEVTGYENNIYSFILLEESNNINIINKTVGDLSAPEHDEEILSYIVDLNNDNKYEIVTSFMTGDDKPIYAKIYEYNGDNYYEVE